MWFRYDHTKPHSSYCFNVVVVVVSFFFLQVVVVLDYEYDYEVAKINVQWGSESPVTEIYWASEPN